MKALKSLRENKFLKGTNCFAKNETQDRCNVYKAFE